MAPPKSWSRGAVRTRKTVPICPIHRNTKTIPNDGPPYSSIELTYKNSVGERVTDIIKQDTPADVATEKLNRFLLAEEEINGDPLKGLGGTKPRIAGLGTLAVGGVAGATVPSYCRSLLNDGPAGNNRLENRSNTDR